MSDPSESQNHLETCRICGKSGVNLRHLFHDEELKNDFCPKIHAVFPHILIYENDPLPKGLCEGCELFVYATHEKLVEFNKAQRELVTPTIDDEEDEDYFKAFNEVSILLDRIQEIKNNLIHKSSKQQSIPKQKISLQKTVQRNETETFQSLALVNCREEVRTLKRICIDYFNKHGPELLNSVLKIEPRNNINKNRRLSTKGSKKKRSGYKSFGERKKKRRTQSDKGLKKPVKIIIKTNAAPEHNSIIICDNNVDNNDKVVTDPEPPKVINSDTNLIHQRSPSEIASNDSDDSSTRRSRRSRAVSRVNYVDDIPDSVLFYVERQETKRRKMEEKVILESIKEAKQQKIIPAPSEKQLVMNSDDIICLNPESEIKINSAMSVPPFIISLTNGSIITPDRLFNEKDLVPSEIVNTISACQVCGLICDNLKVLAIHNMEHLSLRIRRIGERESLPVHLRRGMMMRERGLTIVKCSSCLKTFRNADQIKKHWSMKNCEFYCPICYVSFHLNPEQIGDHLLSVHGLRRRASPASTNGPKISNEPIKTGIKPSFSCKMKTETPESSPSGSSSGSGFKLKVKSVSMINASAPVDPVVSNNPRPNNSPFISNDITSEVPPLYYPIQHQQQQFPQDPDPYLGQYSSSPAMLPSSQMANQRAVCHICHCSFPNINSRNSHMKIHKRFPETSSTSHPSSLGLSMAPYTTTTPPPPIVMTNNDYLVNVRPCGFQYYNRVEFLQHRTECKDCRYACTMCPKAFQVGSELQMHLMLEHPRSLTFKR